MDVKQLVSESAVAATTERGRGMEQPVQQSSIEESQPGAILQAVELAVKGYRAKHPNASGAEIEAFADQVEARIRSSRRSSRSLEERKARHTRRLKVNELIKKHNLQIENIRYFKVPSLEVCSRGGVTMAYRNEGGKTIVAAALCSQKDNFDYLAGRELAVERFTQGLWVEVDTPTFQDAPLEQVIKTYFSFLREAKAALAS